MFDEVLSNFYVNNQVILKIRKQLRLYMQKYITDIYKYVYQHNTHTYVYQRI